MVYLLVFKHRTLLFSNKEFFLNCIIKMNMKQWRQCRDYPRQCPRHWYSSSRTEGNGEKDETIACCMIGKRHDTKHKIERQEQKCGRARVESVKRRSNSWKLKSSIMKELNYLFVIRLINFVKIHHYPYVLIWTFNWLALCNEMLRVLCNEPDRSNRNY